MGDEEQKRNLGIEGEDTAVLHPLNSPLPFHTPKQMGSGSRVLCSLNIRSLHSSKWTPLWQTYKVKLLKM